jgi:hypothetical protein
LAQERATAAISPGFTGGVLNRETVNRTAATASQCWRLNQLGLLEIREEPGDPIPRDVVKELLAEAVERGLWAPKPKKGKR